MTLFEAFRFAALFVTTMFVGLLGVFGILSGVMALFDSVWAGLIAYLIIVVSGMTYVVYDTNNN